MTTTADVLTEVEIEVESQDEKWGEQNHPLIQGESARRQFIGQELYYKQVNDARVRDDKVSWDGILLEEVFEALAQGDGPLARDEWVQIAAVAVNAIKCIDRNRGEPAVEAVEDEGDEAEAA